MASTPFPLLPDTANWSFDPSERRRALSSQCKTPAIGIDPDLQNQLFDAFFSTKPDGMGMGLSISRSIIESHGGRIWASNNDGPGATFQFFLPSQAAGNTASS